MNKRLYRMILCKLPDGLQRGWSRSPERGAALMQALWVVFAASAVASLLTLHHQHAQEDHKLSSLRAKRDDIGTNLGTELLNPAVIEASTAVDIDEPGNQALRHCLGYDYTSTSQGVPPTCDPTKEWMFLVVPPSSHVFPTDKSAGKNCPEPSLPPKARAASCYRGGIHQGKPVAYTFRGETASYGKGAPLKALAYFKPICKTAELVSPETLKKPCYLAEAIQFRYEIQHAPDPSLPDKLGMLGRFPSTPHWIDIDASRLVGKTCNIGAKVVASAQGGAITCRCHTPYEPLESVPGVLAVNARGPLCKVKTQACPRGLVVIGHKPNGDALCESPRIGTYGFSKSIKSTQMDEASCRYDGGKEVGGWIAQMRIQCSSALTFKEEEGSGFDPKMVAIGAGGALLAGLVLNMAVVGSILLMTSAVLVFSPLALLAILAVAAVGALVGAIFAVNYNWHLEPKSQTSCAIDREHEDRPVYCPDIECRYDLECRAFTRYR